jgi:hypothetical protein
MVDIIAVNNDNQLADNGLGKFMKGSKSSD